MVAMLKTIVIAFDALPGFQTASLETRFHVAKKLQEFANQEKSFYRKNEVISSSISEILRKINSYLAELEREALGRRDQIEGSRFEIDLGKKSANLPNVRRLSQIERSQTVQRNRLSDSLFEFSQSLENLTKKLKNQRSHSILPLLPKQRNNELKFNREEAALTWGDEDLRALDIPR